MFQFRIPGMRKKWNSGNSVLKDLEFKYAFYWKNKNVELKNANVL